MLTSSSCYEVRAKPLSCEFFKSDSQQDNDCCITCMCIQVITPGSSWPYSMHISQYNSGIPCLGSRRLDSSGRKKERARERRPFFLAPTISKRLPRRLGHSNNVDRFGKNLAIVYLSAFVMF